MVEALSAKIEMEIGELEPDEAAVFRRSSDSTESSLERVIRRQLPSSLGLISFFTAGPDEPGLDDPRRRDRRRRRGGDPHRPRQGLHPRRDDRVRGPARAGSTAEARKVGKLRSEGQTYRVRDGDVIEILFSR